MVTAPAHSPLNRGLTLADSVVTRVALAAIAAAGNVAMCAIWIIGCMWFDLAKASGGPVVSTPWFTGACVVLSFAIPATTVKLASMISPAARRVAVIPFAVLSALGTIISTLGLGYVTWQLTARFMNHGSAGIVFTFIASCAAAGGFALGTVLGTGASMFRSSAMSATQ